MYENENPTPPGAGFPSERYIALLLAAFFHQSEMSREEQLPRSGVVGACLRVTTPDHETTLTPFDFYTEVEAAELHDTATESV